MIRVILWDVDDTLLDFHAAEREAIKKLFVQFGLGECTDEMLKKYSAINRTYWKRLELGELTKPQILIGRFKDFFEEIKAGDSVILTYRSGYHKFLYRNEVVDLTINGKQIRTLEEHNAYNEGSEAFYIGALVVLIIVNFFVFVTYLLLYNKKIQKLIADAEKKKRRARYR